MHVGGRRLSPFLELFSSVRGYVLGWLDKHRSICRVAGSGRGDAALCNIPTYQWTYQNAP